VDGLPSASTVPGAHCFPAHSPEEPAFANWPGLQFTHGVVGSPSSSLVPALHASTVSQLPKEPAGAYAPALHCRQGVSGLLSWSVHPSGHCWHSPARPAAVYVPGEQSSQGVEGSLSRSVVPGLHSSEAHVPDEPSGRK